MITLYGLKNCDSCRKAMKAYAAAGKTVRFHDLRADGLEAARLEGWLERLGWERLINRRSTTWRHLEASEKAGLDNARALALGLKHPSLLKRPIVESDDGISVGFDAKKL